MLSSTFSETWGHGRLRKPVGGQSVLRKVHQQRLDRIGPFVPIRSRDREPGFRRERSAKAATPQSRSRGLRSTRHAASDAPPAMKWNPPPGWPSTPDGWSPPAGWEPDPSWPPAPFGWPLWLPQHRSAEDDGDPALQAVDQESRPNNQAGANRGTQWWLLPGLALSLLTILIGTGAWLLTGGGAHAVRGATRTLRVHSTTASPPSPKSSPTVTPTKSSAPVDWRNHTFKLAGQTCLAGTPKTVTVLNGTGTGQNVTVTAFKTISGDFGGDGTKEFAVLLGCHGSGNGSGSEVQVFTRDGKLLQRLLPPGATDPGAGFSPQFDRYGMLAATAGSTPGSAFTTSVYSWAAGDAHCCPSRDVVYRWSWSGKTFVSGFDHVVTPTAAPTVQSVPVPVRQPVTVSCDNVAFTAQASDSGAWEIFATNTDCAIARDLALDGSTGSVPVGGYDFFCTSALGTEPGLQHTHHTCRDPYGRVVTWIAT
jgi:hypothetical protein